MNRDPKRAEEIFAEAISQPSGSARESFLRQACGADSDLRTEVESLLNAHYATGEILAVTRRAPDTLVTRAGLHNEAELTVSSGERAPRLAGFTLRQKLGSGGLGTVYLARDEKLQRDVALKILHQSTVAGARERVLTEARKAAALRDPGIVTIYSVLDDADPPAIVMEVVEGFPIDIFSQHLTLSQRAGLLREVARALAVAHKHGVIHRDLKPDNVLVGLDFRPRILDFGLALSSQEAAQGRGLFEGSPLYASPEQVEGKPLTAAADVFSFGSLMFKVLTGRPPFAGNTISDVLDSIRSTYPPFLREVAVGVPEDLQAICLACLSRDPSHRPAAEEVALDLGRYLAGEPVRSKPKLYDDLLRQRISEFSRQTHLWQSQNMISRDERDSIEVVHRRILAEEDEWIIDARRITRIQTVLFASTWVVVVAALLLVWMLRKDLAPIWRWLLPSGATVILLGVGHFANRRREMLAAATFLAGAALSVVPSLLSLFAEIPILEKAPEGVKQLFEGTFTNQQLLAASCAALLISVLGLWRLRMTGFAWTTAALGVATWVAVLLLFNWLDKKPETQALWCLPLVVMEAIARAFEARGRVRWTLPFHLVALLAMVACLDVMAFQGPTLRMMGLTSERHPYFDDERLQTMSLALNGVVFLALMLTTERCRSLDLRRAAKLLEVMGIVHLLSPLFYNAIKHEQQPYVRVDVFLYLAVATAFVLAAPWRSRWQLLVGGLVGWGLGSYLLVDLNLVSRKPFILLLGTTGLLIALGTYLYLLRLPWKRRKGAGPLPLGTSELKRASTIGEAEKWG